MHPLVAALALFAANTAPGPLDHRDARLLIDAPQALTWHPASPNVVRAVIEAAVADGWCDRHEFGWCSTPEGVVRHAAECREWCRGCGPEFTPDERWALRERVREADRVIAHLEQRAGLEQDRAADLLAYAGWLKGRRCAAKTALDWPDWFRCHRRRAATDYRASGADAEIVPRDYYRLDP